MNTTDYLSLITSLATVILVGITAWYAFITKKILKSNEQFSNEQMRPFIVANLFSEDTFIKLEIKNIGKRPAKKVNVTFEPTLNEIDKLFKNSSNDIKHEPLLNQEFMPPNFKVITSLMHTPYFVEQPELPRKFLAKLTYLNLNGDKYEEEYLLDLSNHVYAMKTVDFSAKYYFNEIGKQLSEINKTIKDKKL